MPNQINLYSTILHKNVKPRLQELIGQAECLQMSVAYWTINKNYFSSSGDLINILTKKDSFACIDISLPTNVSNVCEIAAQTDTLYFYTRSFSKVNNQDQEQTSYMANHLLHSKIILFELPDGQASIWIGSHNWTDRALSGINIETSIEILVDRNNRIYQEVKKLLADIKNQCHKVNPQLEEVYKNIQRQENTWLYFQQTLDEKISTPLDENTNIVFHLLFYEDNPENIDNKRKIFLFVQDSIKPKSGFLFEGTIARSGQIKPGLRFPNLEDGYYCFQQNDGFTRFKGIENLSKEEKEDAYYYATITTDSLRTKDIASIDEFFLEYKPAITIRRNRVDIKIVSNENLTLLDTENKIISIISEEPIINDSKIDDYTSKITHGKIAKVTKKIAKVTKKKETD